MNDYKDENEVAIITGGNSGVGFALAQRLLSLEITLTVCLACRNVSKAGRARDQLKLDYPGAKVDTLQLDTSSIASVNAAAKEIQRRYQHVDYLYLNAGTMAETAVDWPNLLFIPLKGWSESVEAITTGEGMIKMVDSTTEDGLRLIFQTNLFGHYLLVKRLEKFLSVYGCQIVWTSSSNARRRHFSLDDIQHRNGIQPYSSSKFAVNILSVALNDRLQDKGIYSRVVSPGFSITGMTSPLLADFLWTLVYPIFIVLRLVVVTMCVTAWNSAEALVWLYRSDPQHISPRQIHTSCVSVLGKPYIQSEWVDIEEGEPDMLYEELERLRADMEASQ